MTSYSEFVKSVVPKNYAHFNEVPIYVFRSALQDLSNLSATIDVLRKLAIHGKAPESDYLMESLKLAKKVAKYPTADVIRTNTSGHRMHAVLGIISELHELIPYAYADATDCLDDYREETGETKPIDAIVLEEAGDILFYLELLLGTYGLTVEKAIEVNQAKLKQRYPDGYSTEKFNNRDVEAEQKIINDAADNQVHENVMAIADKVMAAFFPKASQKIIMSGTGNVAVQSDQVSRIVVT